MSSIKATFKAFLEETSPEKFAEILIQKGDLRSKVKVVGGYEVTLHIHGHTETFYVKPGDIVLHRLNSEGKLDGKTPFVLEEPLEPKRDIHTPIHWE